MAIINAITALKKLKRESPQLLLVFGHETILLNEVVNRYVAANSITDLNSLNYTKVASDFVLEGNLRLLDSPPMFANTRLVVVTDFDKVWSNSNLREKWNDIVNNLIPTTNILFIDNDKPNKRIKLYKSISKIGYVVECNGMSSDELVKWVTREFKRRNYSLSKPIIEHFIERVGTNMSDLRNEIEKTTNYCIDKDSITTEDINKVVIPSIESGIFACVDALGAKDVVKAYKQLQNLIKTGEPPLRILIMFIRQIRLILQTKLLLKEEYSKFYIMKELGIPEFVVKKLQIQANNFSESELKSLLVSLNELEDKMKTGKIEPKLGLETWLLNII